jgi:hypothetical protein
MQGNTEEKEKQKHHTKEIIRKCISNIAFHCRDQSQGEGERENLSKPET